MYSPHLLMLLAQARQDELRRTAAARNRHRHVSEAPGRVKTRGSVTLRACSRMDESAVRRLAALASVKPPVRPVLLAEVDGQLGAALSLCDGAVVVDPSHRTAGLTELLRAWAHELDGSVETRRRRRFRRSRNGS